MKKNLFQIIEIPEGVSVSVNENLVEVKGSEGENNRRFNLGKLVLSVKDNQVSIGNEKATKTEKRLMNTITAHINNMIKGVQEKFEYKLKICFSHFPMNVNVEGEKVIIKNFLGEKISRQAKVPKGAEIKIDKEIITITAVNKEIAGQAAANLEKATRVTGRDRRVFQDGIFITNKCGKEI